MMASQTIEEKFVELQNSKQIPQNSRPKIQRVAEHIRNGKNFEKHYYSPKLVSIGPIHHDNTNLKLGEKYKLMWAAKYIESINKRPKDLYQKIAGKIDELKGRFDDDVLTLTGKSLEGFGSLEEKLSWMLFVDGCSLLYILEYLCINIKVDQMVLVMNDVLLLENQLPYEVLKLLCKNNNESELKESMRDFLNFMLWKIIPVPDESQSENNKGEGHHSVSIPNESPIHLLDLHRKIILTPSNSKTKSNKAINKKRSEKLKKLVNSVENGKLMIYRNIQDLRAVGIRFKLSATQRPTEIEFSAGWFSAELILPKIVVDDTSAATFLNLIAYEMCPDFENDYGICSFVAFMDSLIDHPEDVKVLGSKGILLNCLGSEEEVANLFNIIATDTVNTSAYVEVHVKILEHYNNKWKTWIAQGLHTYFSNPWAIIAFLAAFIALALTFIQTWFTISPA